jgi:kanamycin kinase
VLPEVGGFPRDEDAVVVPAAVRALAGEHRLRPVWCNELGGLTFALSDGHGPGDGDGRGAPVRFVKWTPAGSGLDLGREIARLRWAALYAVVPAVLACGGDDEGAWMVTAAIPGETAVSDRWRADPARAVAAIGEGLRRLHAALPVAECPFRELVVPWLTPAQRASPGVHALLATAPPPDRVEVCHGDACSPKTLLDADGRFAGHVDLGQLGVADRWADLAIATWSTEWNYGPGWEAALLDSYGVAPDPVRTAFYRKLWDPPDTDAG